MASLKEVVARLDELLAVATVADWSTALNGLQLEAGETVDRVAVAVDASEEVILKALGGGAHLLLVHHGLFWGGLSPLRGPYGRKLKLAMKGGLSVYAAHLPLDIHPDLGNNAQLAKRLGLSVVETFAPMKGVEVGLVCQGVDTLEELAARCREVLGEDVKVWPHGKTAIAKVGVITGGAGSEWPQAVAAGVDVLLTGEGQHYTVPEAREHGLALIYGGHYKTEQFGVQAVGQWLQDQLGLDWFFVDSPTGL